MIRIINEETKKKRIARYGEFDNGHVIHGDWKDMSSDEAEDMARRMSIKNPDDIYYVKYDDIMDPDSDLRWINGKSYHYSEVGIRSGKPYIKDKNKVTESDIKFLPVRGNKSIRTIVWNKNNLSTMSLYRISRKYGIEISPVDNSYSSIWMKTNKNNIENLFSAFAEINDNYTADEVKEIYNSVYLKISSKI